RSLAESARVSIAICGDPSDEIPEILGFPEITVDRGEADIGDLIEARQRLHDEAPDHIARDVGLARALQLTHQRADYPFYPFRLERALSQGDVDRSGEFVAVEWFAVSIFLNHGQLA